jgi:hypothetical protein
MRALKALVIVMGVLILAGMGLVGYAIVKKVGPPETSARATASLPRPPIAGTPVAGPYGPVQIALPPGARLLRTHADGDRLLVELQLSSGGARVLVVDLRSGALQGSIDLKPQP